MTGETWNTEKCEKRRELEKGEAIATLWTKIPTNYTPRLLLTSSICAPAPQPVDPGSNPTVASRFLRKPCLRVLKHVKIRSLKYGAFYVDTELLCR